MPARLRPQTRRDDGAAMVEFAFVAVLLVMLVFGIVTFGLLLSFKQDVTRAAGESARVAAVAQPPMTQPASMTDDPRYTAAFDAAVDSAGGFNKACDGTDGLQCLVTIHDCTDPTTTDPSVYWQNNVDDCVTVELVYAYNDFPLILEPPVISAVLPNEIASTSVARLNQ